MTSIGRGSGGPPWPVDLLADLQAGALDPRQADELWPQVNADAEAMAILAALEATQADLREFADAPAPPMPAHFAAQLDAAIAAESQARSQQTQTPPQQAEQQAAPVISLDAARKRRNRGWAIGVFAAAAAAVGITFAALPGGGSDPNGNVAAPGPLTFDSKNVGPDQLQAAKGGNDYGPFSDKQKLAACFEANNVNKNAEPLGAKQVTVDGKQGTLFVIASTPPGTFRLLAVGPNCGPGNADTLANKPGVK
nr:hypothetical protein [Kibdelosporangium sp. MJ126-NF4]CEL15997.1 hypothetical protein [Kibdelosporangium sp. MJ126-NF4]CTQ93921.1 hypothetical protein [Kibdelosporangium sp. MJ126-NF4]